MSVMENWSGVSSHYQREEKGNFPFLLTSSMAKPSGLEFWAQFPTPHPSPFEVGQAGRPQRKRDKTLQPALRWDKLKGEEEGQGLLWGQTEKTKEVAFNTWWRHIITLMGAVDYKEAWRPSRGLTSPAELLPWKKCWVSQAQLYSQTTDSIWVSPVFPLVSFLFSRTTLDTPLDLVIMSL